jgi:hypothetical protein
MAPSGKSDAVSTALVDLTDEQRRRIAEKKATCPFIASAVEGGALGVRNSAERPLAAIDDVVALGDSGGGDLGSWVLKLFARGNHSLMPGSAGKLDKPVPPGMFSLDLAGSQGGHPGHSGILLGDPDELDTGRFSAADFERLANRANDYGLLTTKAVGEFIAENIARDPDSPENSLKGNVIDFAKEIGDSLLALLGGRATERDTTELVASLTNLMGTNNLIGSAGEFGLLFAFLANRPGAADDAIRLADVEEMMVHHRFPPGWQSWPKKTTDWLRVSTKIAAAAGFKSHANHS